MNMDTEQIQSLRFADLVALLIALCFEVARRLEIPIPQAAASSGDTERVFGSKSILKWANNKGTVQWANNKSILQWANNKSILQWAHNKSILQWANNKAILQWASNNRIHHFPAFLVHTAVQLVAAAIFAHVWSLGTSIIDAGATENCK